MKDFIEVPLYTYRVFCEGGHVFSACLPEQDTKAAFRFVKSSGYFVYIDVSNKVKDVSYNPTKVIGIDSLSKDPRIIGNNAGKIEARVYDPKKDKVEKPETPVGRVARKGHS